MDPLLYRLDETGWAVLMGLRVSGRNKTFTQILNDAAISYENSKQVELATTLESLGIIQNVTYRLPLEIRAELSPTGEAMVDTKRATTRNTINPQHTSTHMKAAHSPLPPAKYSPHVGKNDRASSALNLLYSL